MKFQNLTKAVVVFSVFGSNFTAASRAYAQLNSPDQINLTQSSTGGSSSTKSVKKGGGEKKKATSTKSGPSSSGPSSGSDDGYSESSSGSSTGSTKHGSSTSSSSSSSRGPQGLALGLSLGWEALYGNGVIIHFLPSSLIDLHGGFGYTLSGFRVGAGGGINLFFGRSFAMNFGAALTYTSGSKGEVSLTAKFSPEGESGSEDLIATKDYEISSSEGIVPYAGIMFELTKGFYLSGLANYNAVIGGNKVTLGDAIRFDKEIQTTNEDTFESDFNDKAKERAAAGGIGFTVGGLMFL
jgi:hypothetical protein